MSRLAPLFVCCLGLAALWPKDARADGSMPSTDPTEAPRSLWRPLPTFPRGEGVASVAAGIHANPHLKLAPPTVPRWPGASFPVHLSSSLRLRSLPLLFLVDPVVATWAAPRESRNALELELVSLEAFSYAGLFPSASTRLSVREPHEAGECRSHGKDASCAGVVSEGRRPVATSSSRLVCSTARTTTPEDGSADAGSCDAQPSGGGLLGGSGGGLGLGQAIPPLLRYSDEETNVSVSISPGGPCTGACLKVAGSF